MFHGFVYVLPVWSFSKPLFRYIVHLGPTFLFHLASHPVTVIAQIRKFPEMQELKQWSDCSIDKVSIYLKHVHHRDVDRHYNQFARGSPYILNYHLDHLTDHITFIWLMLLSKVMYSNGYNTQKIVQTRSNLHKVSVFHYHERQG